MEEQVLDRIEDRVSSGDDTVISLEEEMDNDYFGAIGESRNPFLSDMTQA